MGHSTWTLAWGIVTITLNGWTLVLCNGEHFWIPSYLDSAKRCFLGTFDGPRTFPYLKSSNTTTAPSLLVVQALYGILLISVRHTCSNCRWFRSLRCSFPPALLHMHKLTDIRRKSVYFCTWNICILCLVNPLLIIVLTLRATMPVSVSKYSPWTPSYCTVSSPMPQKLYVGRWIKSKDNRKRSRGCSLFPPPAHSVIYVPSPWIVRP